MLYLKLRSIFTYWYEQYIVTIKETNTRGLLERHKNKAQGVEQHSSILSV